MKELKDYQLDLINMMCEKLSAKIPDESFEIYEVKNEMIEWVNNNNISIISKIETYGIISLNIDDFDKWIRTKHPSELLKRVKMKEYQIGNRKYRAITRICDLVSYSFDNVISTPDSIKHPDYEEILETVRFAIRQ